MVDRLANQTLKEAVKVACESEETLLKYFSNRLIEMAPISGVDMAATMRNWAIETCEQRLLSSVEENLVADHLKAELGEPVHVS